MIAVYRTNVPFVKENFSGPEADESIGIYCDDDRLNLPEIY